MSVRAWTGVIWRGASLRRTGEGARPHMVPDGFRGSFVQRRHRRDRCIDPFLLGHAFFDRRRNHSRSQRFGQQNFVASFRSAIFHEPAPDFTVPVTEYPNLVSSSRMLWPPMMVQPASIIFDKPAGQNSLQNFQIAFFRIADHRQRGKRARAHGIDIAERICRRDLSEGERIVNDGSKKIDRLHQRCIGRDLIHSGVVGVIEAD